MDTVRRIKAAMDAVDDAVRILKRLRGNNEVDSEVRRALRELDDVETHLQRAYRELRAAE